MDNRKFVFADVLLVPQYAEEKDDSRESDVAGECELFGKKMRVPAISSPMDTITEGKMMRVLWESGAVGVHHRYNWDFRTIYTALTDAWGGVAISPSVDIDEISLLSSSFSDTFFVLDVAHGDSEKVINFCKDLIANGVKNLVSGNIVTLSAAQRYMNIGINHLRVGVGNGSRCTTRQVAGFGYPQGSAIYELRRDIGNHATIISDGGLMNTGDAIKAFSLGADFIMSGYLFAGCDECPRPEGKSTYRGMASREALESRKKEFFVEGESTDVSPKGSVALVIEQFKSAIRNACYYGGVSSFKELYKCLCQPYNQDGIVRITENAFLEGMTRR